MSLAEQWIEVFRAGNYGDKGAYTIADLDQLARDYDPTKHEAPIVVGHPDANAPAYGWVESLKRVGDTLMAKLRQVDPGFEQLVREGKFKKRSVSLYRDQSGLSLRHLGFLGAMPPEVKGLADVKFRDGEHVAIEFREETTMEDAKKTLLEALREFFGGDPKQPKSFSEAEVESAIAKANSAAVAEAIKPVQAKVDELQKFADSPTCKNCGGKLSCSKCDQKNMSEAGERAVLKLKADQKWIPAFDKMGLPQIFAALAGSTITVEFGEGDKKTQKPVLALFAEFIDGLPKMVPGGKLVEFSERNPKDTIAADATKVAEEARQFMNEQAKNGIEISTTDAVRHVMEKKGLPLQ